MHRGAIEMIVRRRLDFRKHSRYVAPAVSFLISSRVSKIAARRFSPSSPLLLRRAKALRAFSFRPFDASHHGDLSHMIRKAPPLSKIRDLLGHKGHKDGSDDGVPVLSAEDGTICPAIAIGSRLVYDQGDAQRSKGVCKSGQASQHTSQSQGSNLSNMSILLMEAMFQAVVTSPIYDTVTEASAPTAKPLRNLPPKNNSLVVATNSIVMAAYVMTRQIMITARRPSQSAMLPQARAPTMPLMLR